MYKFLNDNSHLAIFKEIIKDVKIVDKTSREYIPLILNQEQELVIETLFKKEGTVVLKRCSGSSTAIAAFLAVNLVSGKYKKVAWVHGHAAASHHEQNRLFDIYYQLSDCKLIRDVNNIKSPVSSIKIIPWYKVDQYRNHFDLIICDNIDNYDSPTCKFFPYGVSIYTSEILYWEEARDILREEAHKQVVELKKTINKLISTQTTLNNICKQIN